MQQAKHVRDRLRGVSTGMGYDRDRFRIVITPRITRLPLGNLARSVRSVPCEVHCENRVMKKR